MTSEDKPYPSVPAGPSDWEAACAAYYAARLEHERFLDQVLGPAWRTAEASSASRDKRPPDLSLMAVLERRGDDLCELRHDALRRLVLLPAINVEGLRLKAHLAFDEVLQFSDAEGFLNAIFADLDRLAV